MLKCKAANIALTALFVIALVLFILTFSIGLPIYGRFFYYIQIKTLHLTEQTGWSYDVIKEAYDDVLDYLTLPGHEFGTGQLAWTESEAAHFADCKVLFNLNFWALISSSVVTLTLFLLNRFNVITLQSPWGHKAYFWGGVIALALPVVLIILILCVGFDAAFTAFHSIFFPGKTDWVFNPKTEQIIQVMPEEFFLNCAIIIAVGLIVLSSALIVTDVVIKAKRKKAAKDLPSGVDL